MQSNLITRLPSENDGNYINTIYQINEKIGEGSFGLLYKGLNLVTKEEIAIKFERNSYKAKNSLSREAKILRSLQKIEGIPEIYWYGCDPKKKCKALVMQLLGKSLEYRLKRQGKFSMKTILLLASQLIEIIKNMHGRGVLHRDIKPDNIILGRGKAYKTVYLIDYGISKRYIKSSGDHIILTNYKPFIGTMRYASESAHHGFELSRKDDLESVGYSLLYMSKGSLPWMHQGYKIEEKKEKIGEMKRNISLDELCYGLPSIFQLYFKYIRSLGFYDTPNYDYLKNLFITLQKCLNVSMDTVCWDWSTHSKSTDYSITTQSKSNSKPKNVANIFVKTTIMPEEYEAGITERPDIMTKMDKLNTSHILNKWNTCEIRNKSKENTNLSNSPINASKAPFNLSFLDGSKTVYDNNRTSYNSDISGGISGIYANNANNENYEIKEMKILKNILKKDENGI